MCTYCSTPSLLSTGRMEEDDSAFDCCIWARRFASILEVAFSSLALKTAFATGSLVRKFRTCSVVILVKGRPEVVAVAEGLAVMWLLVDEKDLRSTTSLFGGIFVVEALFGVFGARCSFRILAVERAALLAAEVDPFEEHAARKASFSAAFLVSSSTW